jgi:hypothetical protein
LVQSSGNVINPQGREPRRREFDQRRNAIKAPDRIGQAGHIAEISEVPSMNRRCVATGHDDQGRSVFKSDSQLEPVALGFAPGLEFHRV